MKAHIFKLVIVDFEDYGAEEYLQQIDYQVTLTRELEIITVDLGEWEEDCPLNMSNSTQAQIEGYLSEKMGKIYSANSEYREAANLANSIYKRFYANQPDAVGFELLDTTRGVISQIDNMVCGLLQEIEKLKKK